MNPDSAQHADADVDRVAQVIDPHSLAEFVASSGYGITIRRVTGEYLFANHQALTVLGAPHIAALTAAHLNMPPSPEPATTLLELPDGQVRRIEHTDSMVRAQGEHDAVISILREVGRDELMGQQLASFARAAHSVALAGSLRETLTAITHEVWQTANVPAAQILLIDPVSKRAGMIGAAGAPQPPEDFARRHDQVRRNGGELMSIKAFTEQRVIVSRSRRGRLLKNPAWAPLHDWFGSFQWNDFVAVPLIVRQHSVGALNVYCRHRPTATDLTFFRAMCDQAAIAVENARLFTESKRRSELEERTRIARGLHDAISQKLFSVTLHAKALDLAMTMTMGNDRGESLSTAAGNARAMSELAQSAIQDMRDVINEIYPVALTRDGLTGAVRGYCAGLADREDIQITVSAPQDRLTIDPRAEENLYWLCVEALHNVVKHAKATTASVRIEPDSGGDETILVEVTDDGIGFNPTTVTHRPGHIGLTSMLERAETIGGSLEIISRVGHGTTIRILAPILRPNPALVGPDVGGAALQHRDRVWPHFPDTISER